MQYRTIVPNDIGRLLFFFWIVKAHVRACKPIQRLGRDDSDLWFAVGREPFVRRVTTGEGSHIAGSSGE